MNLYCRACKARQEFKVSEMERVIYTFQMIVETRSQELNEAFVAGRSGEADVDEPYEQEQPLCLLDVLAASTDRFMGRVDVLVEKRKQRRH